MPPEGQDSSGSRQRSRASKACQRCNQKRVKCDALLVGQPCSRCQRGGHVPCVLINSRRGQYPRKRAVTSVSPSRSEPPTRIADAGHIASAQHDTESPSGSPQRSELPSDQISRLRSSVDQTPSTRTDASDNSAAPYPASWAAMFDHFLDSRQSNRQEVLDKCSITYLGESFPLALVLEDLKESGGTRLHHPGPPLQISDPANANVQSTHPAHLLPEEIEFLNAKHAFDLPEHQILDSMVEVFLDTFCPLYPLVHRDEFLQQYQEKKVPWILLQACCFVATTFCPGALIHRAGFPGRRQARFSFYTKAKSLFDLGYEKNKIVVLQSTIMLTFWGAGPNDYWTTNSWIGAGVTIAESLGIHRSLARSNMPSKDRSLLKRLWWILVVLDASCATLFGQPFRINTEHSDAEVPSLDDFDLDVQSPSMANHPLRQTFAHYQVHIAKLSLILNDIDYARFVPQPRKVTIAQVSQALQSWRRELPWELDWNQDIGCNNLLATSLAILYDHHAILLGLGTSGTELVAMFGAAGMDTTCVQHPHERAAEAAQRISSLASNIVMRSKSLSAPHEIYQGVFLAGIVSYVSMRSSQPSQSQLGRLIVNNCQMVLHDVKDTWDAAPWTLALFEKLTHAPPELNRVVRSGEPGHVGIANPSQYDNMAGMEDGLLAYDLGSTWQSNPMLSTLFDLSQGVPTFQ